jgi:HEAT repeat protein
MPSEDNLTMSNFASVQAAAAQQDWSVVSSYLTTVALSSAPPAEQSQILDLALQVLAAGDFQDGWQIAKILPSLGPRAIAPLLAMLQDESIDPEVQWLVGKILSEFRSPAVATALAQYLLHQPDSTLAEIALYALMQMGQVAIDQLTILLSTNKLAAVAALAQIRHSQTIAPLLTVVDDPAAQIRYLAIEALSSFHDPQVPPLLIHKLTDSAAVVRQAAVTGLGLRPELSTVLQSVIRLQPLLLDVDEGVGLATAIALGRLGDESAAPALFTCYQQATCSTLLRRQIVRSLGWIDQPVALHYLQTILNSDQLAIVPEVLRALGQSRQSGTVQILTDYLRVLPAHCPPQIKQEIALSLGNFSKTAAVEGIINLLADPHEQVRWHAIYCLEQCDRDIVEHQLHRLQLSATTDSHLLAGITQCLLAWAKK